MHVFRAFILLALLAGLFFCHPLDCAAQSRIIGGHNVLIDEYPAQVALLDANALTTERRGQFCGGTLIGPDLVLTAAHCLDGRSAGGIYILAGQTQLSKTDGDLLPVVSQTVHPLYDPIRFTNDIAVLKLESPSFQQPARLVESGDPDGYTQPGRRAMAVGWGSLAFNDLTYPDKLKEAQVRIMTLDEARDLHAATGWDVIPDTQLPAGDEGKSPCYGDSGGGLYVNGTDNVTTLVGVVSWGYKCGTKEPPTMYTRVSSYRQWIDSVTLGSPRLVFQHADASGDWTTTLAVVSKNEVQASGTFVAFDNDGREVDRAYVILNPKGRAELDVSRAFMEPERVGYVLFYSDQAFWAGYTRFKVDGLYRVAVPADTDPSGLGNAPVAHIDSGQDWWTGISLVNLSGDYREPTLTFNTGESRTIRMEAGQHKAFTIRSLFEGQARPDITSADLWNADGVLGLELFGNEAQLEGIPLSVAVNSLRYVPFVQPDPSWWTSLALYNSGPDLAAATMIPFTVPGGEGEARKEEIGPRSRYAASVASAFPGQELPADVECDMDSEGQGFFLVGNGGQTLLAGGAMPQSGAVSGVLPVLSGQGWITLAFTDTGQSDVSRTEINLIARNDQGDQLATATVLLSRREQKSGAPADFFESLPDSATYLEFTSSAPVLAYELMGSADGNMMDGLGAM